ncbi:MAG: MFS transporter [Clostridia bacterium]|nr:MFS transporter [Clostridia bacterium]
MQNKKTKRFWIALVLFSLIGQIAWVVENMYFNVFIYKMFAATPAQISFMVSASAVVATVTTIFIGALSDKLGKRKLFISAGYILWGISILAFALVRKDVIGSLFTATASVSAICITITIVLDCLMTFFGSTANDACFNAWVTDVTEPKTRGAAEGVNSMMPLMAILVVFGGFMSFDLAKSSAWTVIFCVIGAVVLLAGVSSIFLVQEPHQEKQGNERYFYNVLHGFRPSTIKNNPVLYGTVAAFALFGISIQVFMPYLIIYYEVSLSMANYVLIMAPAIIIAGGITALYGRYYDKVGFLPSILPALCSLAVGYVLLGAFTHVALVFIGSLCMMTGYLTGMAVFGAMIRDYTPQGKAGAFQGLRIVGQVLIPGIVGPVIGAAVLANAKTIVGNDGTESFIPSQAIFWAALAVLAVVAVVVLCLIPILRKETPAQSAQAEPQEKEI